MAIPHIATHGSKSRVQIGVVVAIHHDGYVQSDPVNDLQVLGVDSHT